MWWFMSKKHKLNICGFLSHIFVVCLFSQAMTVVYLITFVGGHNFWKFTVPILGVSPAEMFELSLYGMYNANS